MYRSVTGDPGASRTPCGLVAVMSPSDPARAVFELRIMGRPGSAGIHDLRAPLNRWAAPRLCFARGPGKSGPSGPLWVHAEEHRNNTACTSEGTHVSMWR